MPYYRRRTNYRRRTYRRNYPRTGYGAMDLVKTAKAAYSGVKYLRSLVNVEKHALFLNASTTPDTNGTVICLNTLSQGDGEANRTGDSILSKMIHVNMKISINAAASNSTVRVILFWYRQPAGATATVTLPLQAASNQSCYNHDTAKLYSVIYDKQYNLSISGQQERSLMITRKFYQVHTTYNGNAGTSADIETNALWMLLISDEATDTPTCLWRSEFMFIDN